MAAQPGYKVKLCTSFRVLLYRRKVSKFYNAASGGAQKSRHLVELKNFTLGEEEIFRIVRNVLWRCGEQGVTIFYGLVRCSQLAGGIKNFIERGLPLEQAERPCEPLDTAHSIVAVENFCRKIALTQLNIYIKILALTHTNIL